MPDDDGEVDVADEGNIATDGSPEAAAAAAEPVNTGNDTNREVVQVDSTNGTEESDKDVEGAATNGHAEVPSYSTETRNKKMARRETRKTDLGSVCKWTKRTTASIGAGLEEADRGEAYYVNTETGETQWDRPDDYFSDEDDLVLDFDPHAPLVETFNSTIDLYGAGEEDRLAMLANPAESGPRRRCEARLTQLLKLVEHAGDELEWDALICMDYMKMPHTVFMHLGIGEVDAEIIHPRVRLIICRLMVLFSKLRPELLLSISDGSWCRAKDTLLHIELGIKDSSTFSVQEEQDESTRAFLVLMASMLGEMQCPSGSEGIASGKRFPVQIPAPDFDFIVRLFDIMSDSTEDVFLASAHACLALNACFVETDETGFVIAEKREANSIMKALITHPKAEYFGEAILHLLNQQSFPYSDLRLLRQILLVLQTMFVHDSTAAFLYTNDLKVLVDIIIRELTADDDDTVREDYLRVTHLMLSNSPWVERGRYRREDLLVALESILENGREGAASNACVLVENIFIDCIAILEA